MLLGWGSVTYVLFGIGSLLVGETFRLAAVLPGHMYFVVVPILLLLIGIILVTAFCYGINVRRKPTILERTAEGEGRRN